MTNQLKRILEDAGWYLDRCIEIDYMIQDLSREGFTIPNILIENLMKEFWNLELNFTSPDGRLSNVRLNIEDALIIDEKKVAIVEVSINEKLVPVGSVHFESAYLLASYSGHFYLLTDGVFYLIGSNFLDSLDRIVNQKEIVKIFDFRNQ